MSQADKLKLNYTGSVKNVWRAEADPKHLWFEFTDDYSVFDWGKMPDQIENKGRALALMGKYFFELLAKAESWRALPQSPHLKKFEQDFLAERFESETFKGINGLSRKGLSSHFIALEEVGPRLLMKVEGARVVHPQKAVIDAQTIYFYSSDQNIRSEKGMTLIPLEVVFRFGMSKGSSLLERLEKDSNYFKTLGLSHPPKPNEWFERPIVEFFTKLEPKDRHLSYQEAALMANLTKEEFAELVELTLLIALFLHDRFLRAGLELWDGKFEYLLQADGQGHTKIVLADSIGPDELRLLYQGKQLSKELIRQYYTNTPWLSALRKAQEEARLNAKLDWKKVCIEKYGAQPEKLSAPFKTQVDNLYATLVNHLTESEMIKDAPPLEQFIARLDELLAETQRN
jgi:phosphoribosylaminoimidazole-succinocarboxamide synthase